MLPLNKIPEGTLICNVFLKMLNNKNHIFNCKFKFRLKKKQVIKENFQKHQEPILQSLDTLKMDYKQELSFHQELEKHLKVMFVLK